MCPELILVNGEDLTYYRRFSRAVTRLVKGIIWNRAVERLGMDELFCDVTDMVQAHLEDVKRGIGTPAAGCSSRIFFNLSQDRSSTTNGFWYEPMSAPSLVIPALVNLVASDSAASQREHAEAHSPLFGIAAHLAAHIRERIHTELGFTTSAGVAHNKTLAKLMASLNKPALQTTWDPEIMKYREEQETFLAGFEARKWVMFSGPDMLFAQMNMPAQTTRDGPRHLQHDTVAHQYQTGQARATAASHGGTDPLNMHFQRL